MTIKYFKKAPVSVAHHSGLYVRKELHDSLWQQDQLTLVEMAVQVLELEQADEEEPEPGQEREVRLTYLDDVILFDFRVADDATTILWKLELGKQPCSLTDH
ncbi:MAG: hypothetical protein ICV83_19310 [Cytophagales bacterium]|nr:hypothetical protein [Cytophagales bacterium]